LNAVRAWDVERGRGIASLRRVDLDVPNPGPGEVRVRLRMAALNARDLWMPDSGTGHVIPGSDGVGVVDAVGDGVTAWQPGDRVAALFYPDWRDGPPEREQVARSLGGALDGVLRDAMLVPEHGLVALPDAIDFDTAATLPTAGLTAWHALTASDARAGDTVLLLGTGGVSILALQLAKAMGLRAIVTSSDDAKLARARALGADDTINYRTHPEWDAQVRALTAGRGADLALDIGGEHTLGASIASVRAGGTVAMIGGASGGFGARIEPFALAGGAKRLLGVLVGHRAMAQALVAFVARHGVSAAIDRRFDFDDAPAAFAHLAAGRNVGKVLIGFG
jgi:NADPH:quinone reductase-like Zn-dependent oxidoreductase